MSKEPRIRDVYQQYRNGQIPFDEVVRVAGEILANYEASRSGDESTRPDVTPRAPVPPRQPRP